MKAPSVHVYVLGPCSEETRQYYPETSAEIAENVTYLGARGQLNLACGISVAFISGTYAETSDDAHYNEATVAELLVPATAGSGFKGVDILLTSEWPQDVHRYASKTPTQAVDGSALIAKVASVLHPRYHIAALHNVHYERQPYRNHRVLQEAATHCTRFVALAQLNNDAKAKFVYAFNIEPMRSMTHEEVGFCKRK